MLGPEIVFEGSQAVVVHRVVSAVRGAIIRRG